MLSPFKDVLQNNGERDGGGEIGPDRCDQVRMLLLNLLTVRCAPFGVFWPTVPLSPTPRKKKDSSSTRVASVTLLDGLTLTVARHASMATMPPS